MMQYGTAIKIGYILFALWDPKQSSLRDRRSDGRRRCVVCVVCVCVGVHVNEQENTRRVVNNRFNECVEAGGSARACRVKQTHQIRLSKCKVVSFQFAPPSFLLPHFLPRLGPTRPPPPPRPAPVLPITRHNNIFLNPVWSLVLLF